MTRLETYFATLVTLFGATATVVGAFIGGLNLGVMTLFWVILVCGSITFVLSFIIGHYIAEPLTDLHNQAQRILQGDTSVVIEPTEKLREADLLATDFSALGEQTKSRMVDLNVQQKRQQRFMTDAAHELRTPLTAIRGNAETLMDPDMPQALRERFCTTIVNECERLTRLSNDLLTLHHVEDGTDQTTLERVNLHSIAEEVANALEPIIEERKGSLIVTGEAPDVLGNPDRLYQVIYNLAANASRFIGENGHIVIRLEGLEKRSVISVIDDGPGFGDIDPNMLFTRFYRGDNSRARNTGGTGLGLAIAKSIVESHDGTIQAVNVAGGGACFIVALPSILDTVH